MTALGEADLQRDRWRRALRREALDTSDRADFAMRGLSARLRRPSVRLLLLPADPDADVIRVDDGLWAWIKHHQVVDIEGRDLRLGTHEVPTAQAAALVDSYGNGEAWHSYVAIHRSGALEYGLGDRGVWELKDRNDKLVRVFNLISVVARTWALLKFGTTMRDRASVDGPFQLTVAMHCTGGAFLGNVAEGWAEPLTWGNELPACPEENLLWHLELTEWPDEDNIRELAFRVGDRLEDAWGVRHRRYLARAGEVVGKLDVRQLRE